MFVPSLCLQRVPPNFCGCLSKPPASLGESSPEGTSAECVKYRSSTSHSQSIPIPGVKLGGVSKGLGGPLGAPCVWLRSEWSCHDLPWIVLILQQFNSAVSGKSGACVRREEHGEENC